MCEKMNVPCEERGEQDVRPKSVDQMSADEIAKALSKVLGEMGAFASVQANLTADSFEEKK